MKMRMVGALYLIWCCRCKKYFVLLTFILVINGDEPILRSLIPQLLKEMFNTKLVGRDESHIFT